MKLAGDTREACVARYYDPTTGQFLSIDPDVAQTLAPFAYVGDDPVNSIDPLGLFCFFGHNPNGSCRGASEVKAVVTNPVFQAITTAAVCTFTGPGCAVINVAFLAANEYYAYQQYVQKRHGDWTAFGLTSALNVASAAIQLRTLPPAGIIAKVEKGGWGYPLVEAGFSRSTQIPLSITAPWLAKNIAKSLTVNGVTWALEQLGQVPPALAEACTVAPNDGR
jgi:hypothetical protein